ncbi:MAG: 5'-nucleotidase C-terminal domain-containing protein [Anaerolineaceae bacterium]|nr:5'-nucleotidase C-terminal domain-containing protein [Anaerolineaceae bacterium]
MEYFIDAEKNPMIEAFNYLKYDVWTFGNHEYNFSLAQRDHLVRQFNGVTLSGNVFLKGEDHSYLPAVTVVERGGVRIGIVGMTTPLIEEFEKGKPSLAEMEVYNPIDCMRSALDELKAQDVDCIVGLVHEGLSEENGVYGSSVTDIAAAFPEFDVIIGGHDHQSVESESEGDVLLLEPFCYARELAIIDLKFEKTEDGYQLVEKAATKEACGEVEDESLAELMAPYREELSAYVNTPIGTLINSDLSRDSGLKGISGVFTGSSGIMNLLGTACNYYSGADVIFLCTDYEDAGFPVGDISIKNISASYSYSGGTVTVYEATGAQLMKLLEWCPAFFNKMEDGDLIVSYNPERRESKYSSNFIGTGICYDIDLTLEAGSRIRNLALIRKDEKAMPVRREDGSIETIPIEADTRIRLATNSYYMKQWIAPGGCLEGETMTVLYSSSEEFGDDDGTVRALTISYIRDVLGGTVNGDDFNYENWKLLTGVDENSAEYRKAVELLNNGTIGLHNSGTGRTNIKSINTEGIRND